MDELFFEDLTEGRAFETAGVTLTDAAIIDFAFQYDPQPFHLDREAAAQSIFGGLIASGFQTLCVSFRLFAQMGAVFKHNLGGPGADEVRWLKPVRAGDTIRCRVSVAEQRPSGSKPDRGSVKWRFETFNQHGELVMTAVLISIVRRRPR